MRNNFFSGAIGGFIGTALNTPFDVVKSRIQNTPNVAGQVRKYNWTYPSIAIVAREEGFGALYKGFTPKVSIEGELSVREGGRSKAGGTKQSWLLIRASFSPLTPSSLFILLSSQVLRLAPGGGVLLLVVEVVLEGYRNYFGPPYKLVD